MNSNLIAFQTIVRKEVTRFLRIWSQTLLPPVITQSLYFIIFGAFIGSQVADINGISYMAFIIPGLVMMGVINSSFMNVVSSFYSSKFMKNYEEFMVSPASNSAIIFGYVIGGALRGLIVGILVFTVSILFIRPEISHLGLILLFIILTSIVFALGGLINGIFARSFDDISIFPTFILTPLTYFGGVFYSIHNLPAFWQTVSKFNPILYMVDGFRYGFYGFSDIPVIYSLSMLVGFTVILYGICVYLLNKGTGLKN